MILEGMIGVGFTYTAYRRICHKRIEDKKIKKEVERKWRLLKDGLGRVQSSNNICQEYDLLEIFPKHYGFDAIVSIPSGKKYLDLVTLIPDIEVGFRANVMMNTTGDKVTAYMRVHYIDRDISVKDNLKFKWFKTFYNLDGCTAKTGETVGIDKIEEIKSPFGEIVGYKIKSKIPVGINYDKIKNSYDVITKTLGKCTLNFNYRTMDLETSIVHIPISDDYKFAPLDIKPWELYIAMGYDWKPIILDYSQNANSLIGGIQGSGKTNALMSAFINLCNKCDGDDYINGFELMICNMGEKNDLRIFRDVKQCKYYGNNEIEVLSMLRYLKKEMNRRNKLFSSRKEFCFNIHQYNKLVTDKSQQLKVIHLLGDEIADFMDNEEIQDLLWDIIRKSRSSGIYITVATQRGSLANMSSEIKGQLANKISFSQPNTASALTVMSGEDVAKRVMSLEKKRECLVDYAEGIIIAKTLYLDERMMEDFLRDIILEDPQKLIIDTNGNIVAPKIEENIEKVSENNEKVTENNEKVDKNNKKADKSDKKSFRFESVISNKGKNKNNNKKGDNKK